MSENTPRDFALQCPAPLGNHATIQLAHGGGGRIMRGLIEDLFRPAFAEGFCNTRDAARGATKATNRPSLAT